MDHNISKEQDILDRFNKAVGGGLNSGVAVRGRWCFTVTRADGTIEVSTSDNIVTKDGLDIIAANMIGPGTGANSAFRYIVIGTQTSAASLDSVQVGIGEVGRKLGSTIASSNEVAILVATWAGAADSITSVVFGTGGMANHADSGSGLLGNHVSSLNATLADSDFLKVQMEVQIGSHNL